MLSDQLLDLPRVYWKIDGPPHWLFPDADPQRHITARQLERVCRQTAEVAAFSKNVTVHTLRHCFAIHLLEQGVDIRVIQDSG
jgi:integrase/recombinase XerD